MIAIPKVVRVAGCFLANLLTAVLSPTIIGNGIIYHVLRPWPWPQRFLAEDLVGALIAFALGYISLRVMKSNTAKWVWVPAFIWFAQRALSLHSHWDRMFFVETGYADVSPNHEAVQTWYSYTLPFVRTAAYSTGAFFCSSVGEKGLRSFFAKFAPLDPKSALSDHDPHAHSALPAYLRDDLRSTAQRMDRS